MYKLIYTLNDGETYFRLASSIVVGNEVITFETEDKDKDIVRVNIYSNKCTFLSIDGEIIIGETLDDESISDTSICKYPYLLGQTVTFSYEPDGEGLAPRLTGEIVDFRGDYISINVNGNIWNVTADEIISGE